MRFHAAVRVNLSATIDFRVLRESVHGTGHAVNACLPIQMRDTTVRTTSTTMYSQRSITADLGTPVTSSSLLVQPINCLHAPPPQEPKRHGRYYFSDGNVVFLVDNTLYNVHRYFFKTYSSVFETMFSLPTSNEPEGLTDDNPIHLPDTTSYDFDQVLSIFYPTEFRRFDPSGLRAWTSVLSVSTRWDFGSLRELAIDKLHDIAPPVNQIFLGKKYNIDAWLIPAYIALCKRQELFTIEEGRMLGTDDLVMIAQFQKRVRDQWGHLSYAPDADIVPIAREIFIPPQPRIEECPLGPSRA